MYALAPFIAWLVAGTLKFVINQIRFGNARERIGNGGFPSNHTTIITTPVALIGFEEGANSPLFGLGVAVAFIVILDATGLRRHVGRHATALNVLKPDGDGGRKFRESMGHTPFEVLGGLVLGTGLGWLLSWLA